MSTSTLKKYNRTAASAGTGAKKAVQSRPRKRRGRKDALSDVEEFSMFVYTFSFLIKDGYQPKRAIDILLAQAGGELKNALAEAAGLVDQGQPIASAFRSTGFFPGDFCALLEVGESSGYLGDALEAYGDYIEKVLHMRKGLESMLNYPTFVLSFIIVAAVLLLIFVVPQMMAAFKGVGVNDSQIPLISKLLFAASGFFQKIGVVPSVAMAAGLAFYLLKGGGKARIAKFFDLIPAMKKVKVKLEWAQWLVLGSICLKSGMTLGGMLDVLASSVPKPIAGSYALIVNNVKAGQPLSGELGKFKGVPPIIPQVIGVAEKSGRVQEAMSSVGRQYLYTLNYDVKNLSGVLEPIIIAMVTLFGGGFAGSLFYTTMAITSSVK